MPNDDPMLEIRLKIEQASPQTRAALAELLAVLDEIAQRGRRLRAAGYVPRRDWRSS